ncbi:MAG: hypothetical protein Q4A65_07090 [Bacillota bacterium]|nr:hypothetical protein [Bacillota bacterium]
MKRTNNGTDDRNEETLLKKKLAWICTLEKKKVEQFKKELKALPEGTLYLNKTSGKSYYEHVIDGKRRPISKDLDQIYQLARKKYLELRLREYCESFTHNGKYLKLQGGNAATRIRKLLKRYGESGLDVMRITCSEKQYRWAHATFAQNPRNPEEKRYSTYSGIKVRSKSEQRIGNELELNGIPYRYEQLFRSYVGWMEGTLGGRGNGYKDYYPDFIIMTATGDTIIWEHLGRVDLEDYRAHNAEKICAYRQGEGIKDDMLILTFEKDFQDANYLRELIAQRVLPYV